MTRSALRIALMAVVVVVMGFAAPAAARRKPPTTTTSPPTTTTPVTTSSTTTTTTTSTTTTSTTTTQPPQSPVTGGYDVSWPQCSTTLPKGPAFGVVGVSNGRAFSDNPCLATQYAWAQSAPRGPAVYMNTANPGAQSVHWTEPGPKSCAGASSDLGCAYNYGWNAAAHSFAFATGQGSNPPQWWLDIETLNTWSSDTTSNTADVHGMVDYLQAQGRTVGVYSTAYQWGVITGGAPLAVPNWVAGATSASQAASWCTPSKSFTGGPVALIQYPIGSWDGDAAC